MKLSSPIVFEPLFMERIWGGRRLETLYGKRLPQSTRIGESWEIVDRPEAQSVVHDGPLRGMTLHELWTQQRETIFGPDLPDTERFPLLCKVLDAQDRLSLQVHPPESVASILGGEPKTEIWYVLDALLDSDLYAGLKRGVTQETFERALHDGVVAEQIHHLRVKKGDAVFIPSGRVHAIGAGNMVAEVQQNSDTTYRVFDWNRTGVDGRPRDLHIEASLASIDFDDHEPTIVQPAPDGLLVENQYFRIEKLLLDGPCSADRGDRFSIFVVTEGSVAIGDREFTVGSFFLVPPVIAYRELRPVDGPAVVLRTTIPAVK
jgi:mannose-6-phosphate isomerase